MSKTKREAAPGTRTRRDAALVEVKPVDPPSLESRGTAHVITESIIQGGPAALLANDQNAKLLAEHYGEVFGEEFKAQWTFETKWLQSLQSTHRGRVQANYAMQWRPTFLAVVALAHGVILGCRASGVAPHTVISHRAADPDFDAQVVAAQAHCIQLLHSVTMRDAIEGILEPVLWQGIPVAYVRKVDNRLRIEMLRAHMPETFKTPGSKVQISTGNNLFLGEGAQLDQEKTMKLVGMRQESLRRLQEKKANAREVGTLALPPVPPMT